MRSTDSFADILARKIEKEVEARLKEEFRKEFETGRKSEEKPAFKAYPDYIASLLGMNKTFTTSGKIKGGYKIRPHSTKTRKPHVLNDQQSKAWWFFSQSKQELSPCFTFVELKKAYHHLAFQFHPDKKGDPRLFIELKRSFETLKTLF